MEFIKRCRKDVVFYFIVPLSRLSFLLSIISSFPFSSGQSSTWLQYCWVGQKKKLATFNIFCKSGKVSEIIFTISLFLLNDFLKERSKSNIFQNQFIWQDVGYHLTKKICTALKPGWSNFAPGCIFLLQTITNWSDETLHTARRMSHWVKNEIKSVGHHTHCHGNAT